MNQQNDLEIVVIDANIAISLAAREAATFQNVERVINSYTQDGVEFAAPNVIVAEVLFALCQKKKAGILDDVAYDVAINAFQDLLDNISLAENEAGLVKRATEIRRTYGCSRSSDSLYIALSEKLAVTHSVVIVTLDTGMPNQAKKHAPKISVRVL